MPFSKLEVSTAQHGTLSGAGYLHQSRQEFRDQDGPPSSAMKASEWTAGT
jgi:hypothetical protein